MRIFTLVGKSGTGKSFHAMELSRQNNIEAIIDDGLFIYKNTVMAGSSAKRAGTKIGAVKTALFINDEQTAAVKKQIEKCKPESILILGTSKGMVDKIMERLELPKPADDSPNRIAIEDITTEAERRKARQQRDQLGKHVIPAPAPQLKRSFAGYFMDQLRFFRGKDQGLGSDRTVVRPTYSYLGDYLISERSINDIVSCVVKRHPAGAKTVYISQSANPEAYEIFVAMRLRHGYPAWQCAAEIQKQIKEAVEGMTAFNVSKVDIEIRAVD